MTEFDENIRLFIKTCSKHGTKMLMVDGTAVNFHGYRRHSADVDFWIDISRENLLHLKTALQELGFKFDDFPNEVYEAKQISVKISPDMEMELITAFSLDKTFDEAFHASEEARIEGGYSYRVISLNDLIDNKKRSGRPKDLLDIQELKRIANQ